MVGTGIWRENSKTWKIDTHTVEPGIWRDMKNDKCTLQDLAYGEKTEKRGK